MSNTTASTGGPACGSSAGTSGTQPLLQAIHETLAEGHLLQGDELVGLVRLVDRAGTADDRRNAAGVEPAGLGAEGHLASGLAAGQRLGQLDDLGAGGEVEAVKPAMTSQPKPVAASTA